MIGYMVMRVMIGCWGGMGTTSSMEVLVKMRCLAATMMISSMDLLVETCLMGALVQTIYSEGRVLMRCGEV